MKNHAMALILLGTSLTGCGVGGVGTVGITNPPPLLNPTATIVTISPNSADPGSAAFTLSLVGSNFIPTSTVQWNGTSRLTTYLSATLVTAEIGSNDVAGAGPDTITVLNPAPAGGLSNAKDFVVPCVIPTPTAAANQSRAKVGAFYFDGWATPLNNFHFDGLLNGNFKGREPLSGWQDAGPCAIERQLAWAHNFGIDFFVFDWYFNATVNEPGDNLNSALQITHSLTDRHGMQYAIQYVSAPPFLVGPSDWASAVEEWVGYMSDPAYLRINGEPALFIINVGQVRQDFGSSIAVANALQHLRTAAVAKGLPGVYVVGGFGIPEGTVGQESLDDGFDIAGSDGYDAVAFYNYPFGLSPIDGMLPFSALADTGRWSWDQARLHCPIPFVPTAMAGWDPRPPNQPEPVTGKLLWYGRSAQEVAALLQDSIAWVQANPLLRPEPVPAPPLVLIEAWNELGEGSSIVPGVADGSSYGDAIAQMLTAP
jgi:hypothetical protein